MTHDQPTDDIKLQTLAGAYTGWAYRFDPSLLPSTAHDRWSNRDWINFIGDNWYRRFAVAPRAPGQPSEASHG